MFLLISQGIHAISSVILISLSFMHEVEHLLIGIKFICIFFLELSGYAFCPFSSSVVVLSLPEVVVILIKKIRPLSPAQEGGELPISKGVGRDAGGPRAGWAGVPGNKSLVNTTAQVVKAKLRSDLCQEAFLGLPSWNSPCLSPGPSRGHRSLPYVVEWS